MDIANTLKISLREMLASVYFINKTQRYTNEPIPSPRMQYFKKFMGLFYLKWFFLKLKAVNIPPKKSPAQIPPKTVYSILNLRIL